MKRLFHTLGDIRKRNSIMNLTNSIFVFKIFSIARLSEDELFGSTLDYFFRKHREMPLNAYEEFSKNSFVRGKITLSLNAM